MGTEAQAAYAKADVLERLRKWAAMKQGELMPDNWGPALSVDLCDAVAEIEYLRSLAGAVTPGQSFTEMREGLRGRREPTIAERGPRG